MHDRNPAHVRWPPSRGAAPCLPQFRRCIFECHPNFCFGTIAMSWLGTRVPNFPTKFALAQPWRHGTKRRHGRFCKTVFEEVLLGPHHATCSKVAVARSCCPLSPSVHCFRLTPHQRRCSCGWTNRRHLTVRLRPQKPRCMQRAAIDAAWTPGGCPLQNFTHALELPCGQRLSLSLCASTRRGVGRLAHRRHCRRPSSTGTLASSGRPSFVRCAAAFWIDTLTRRQFAHVLRTGVSEAARSLTFSSLTVLLCGRKDKVGLLSWRPERRRLIPRVRLLVFQGKSRRQGCGRRPQSAEV